MSGRRNNRASMSLDQLGSLSGIDFSQLDESNADNDPYEEKPKAKVGFSGLPDNSMRKTDLRRGSNILDQLKEVEQEDKDSDSDSGSKSSNSDSDSQSSSSELEEDEDAVYLEALDAQEKAIQKIEQEPIQFILQDKNGGSQLHDFRMNDPIFKLKELCDKANKQTNPNPKCTSCRVAQINTKETNVCEFCANTVCKDCFTKTRQFPMAIRKDGEPAPRGTICKLCDRKFLLKMVMDEQESRVALKKYDITQKKKDQNRLEKRIEQLETLFKQTRALSNHKTAEIKDRTKVLLGTNKKRRSEYDVIKKENEILIQQTADIQDQIEKVIAKQNPIIEDDYEDEAGEQMMEEEQGSEQAPAEINLVHNSFMAKKFLPGLLKGMQEKEEDESDTLSASGKNRTSSIMSDNFSRRKNAEIHGDQSCCQTGGCTIF